MGCTLSGNCRQCRPDDPLNPPTLTLSMLYHPFPPQLKEHKLVYERPEFGLGEPLVSAADQTVPCQRLHKSELWATCAVDAPKPWRLNVIEKLKQVQALYNMKEGWSVMKEMKIRRDINQQTRPAEDSEWDIVRTDGLINESALAILSVLMNYRLRGRYDSMWESGGVVDSLGQDTRINYLRTKRKMFIIRDMVLLTHDIFLRNLTIISLSFSIKAAQWPPQRGVVRAHCKFQCWILRPIRDSNNASLHKTHVTLMTHIDPRGTIGHLGKPYYYNLFGAKPLQNLQSYIHKQTSGHGYRRIRQSMYHFYVSQNREESIHNISDNEAPGGSLGLYDEVKNLNARWDKDPVSKLIDLRLRYPGVKNPPPGCPKKPREKKNVTKINSSSKRRRSFDCNPLPDNQKVITIEDDEKTPTATNPSFGQNECSSTAGNSVQVIGSSEGDVPKPVVMRKSQHLNN